MTSELPTGAITGATKCLRVARRGQVVVVEVLLSSSSSGWTWWQRLWRTGVPLASVQAARGIEGCEGTSKRKRFNISLFLSCYSEKRRNELPAWIKNCFVLALSNMFNLLTTNKLAVAVFQKPHIDWLCLWNTIRINTWKIRLVRWYKWVNEGEVPAIGAPGRQFGVSFVFKPALDN